MGILRLFVALVVAVVAAAWTLDLNKELSEAVEKFAGRSAAPVAPAPAATTPPAEQFRGYGDEMVIPAGPSGHFIANAEVNGYQVRFLIDTGASIVMLTPDDAQRVGLRPFKDDFSLRLHTPNGDMRGAPVILGDVRLGPIEIVDVEATVVEVPSEFSLLGMSFLGRLQGYEVRNGELVLRW
jgi:aspartyl protease family protein